MRDARFMSGDERVLAVREWVIRAEGDLLSAEGLRSIPGVPPWSVAFHLQQCAEKYLKALLTARGIPVTKTHEIVELIDRLLPADRPSMDPGIVADLTEYAVGGRYPGRPLATAEDVRVAVDAVQGLRTWVRQRLPAAALAEP
jgi:HEPN domain-containing protein